MKNVNMKEIKKEGFVKKVAEIKNNYFGIKHTMGLLFLFALLISIPSVAFGATSTTAEAKWEEILNFILPWIGRFGGVMALWGGVELGTAWKDDDASGKAKGFKFIMAGVIIIAVRFASDVFLL